MLFYRIRLKRYPNLYVGKKDITYAICSDQLIERLKKRVVSRDWGDKDIFPFNLLKKEKFARIFTSRGDIQRILTLKSEWDSNPTWHRVDATYSEYEVVYEFDGKSMVEPLDLFKRD